jgi:multidrug resistance efflux pump
MHPENEPIVVPMRGPQPPPPVPARVRLGRVLLRAWTPAVWLAALAVCVALFAAEVGPGQALAVGESVEVDVSPAADGRVADLHVELGQAVREGDLVATLDAGDLEARIRLAGAELERERVRAADDEAARRARQNDHAADGRRLGEEADRLATEQAADRAEIAALKPLIERAESLVRDGLEMAARGEELALRRAVLEKTVAAREEAVRGQRLRIEEWRKLEPGDEPTGASRLAIRVHESRIAELEAQRARYRVTAPATGRVLRVVATSGEWLAAGAPVVRLVVARPTRVTAFVSPKQALVVGAGTLASLRARDHAGAVIDGRVLSTGAAVEPLPERLRANPVVPEWGLRVLIEVPPTELLPGDVYRVRFR